MTKPTKTLNDIGAVVVTDDTAVSYLTPETYASIMALIEDRKRLLDEVERLKTAYELQIGDLGEELKK